MSKFIPLVFKDWDSYEWKLYADIVFDFTYLEKAEDFEDEI